MPTHSYNPTRPSPTRVATPGRPALPPVRTGVPSDVADETYSNRLTGARFLLRMEQRGLAHVVSRSFPRAESAAPDLSAVGTVELSWTTRQGHDAVVVPTDEDALVHVVARRNVCEVVVAGRDEAAAQALAERLEEALRDEPPADDRLPLRFWAMGPMGPEVEVRRVEVAAWDDIGRNYPAPARAQVDRLVAATEPVGGSLVLWHGPPGTGKTHALQAVTRAWAPWCTTHYVTDPEQLLRGTGYLMDVATRELGRDAKPWRLIVLEDAGELMAADARSEIGQGLSRVLNLTDGLLGQGLRCMLLVTTNEPLGRLHPAVRRPGRCWAEVEFPAFDAAEATAWLALNEVEADEPRGPRTLAELFALAEGRELDPGSGGRAPFGFARG